MKGYHTRLHSDAITREERGVPPEQFIKQVAALPPGTLFRHDVGGDLWHDRGRVAGALLRQLTTAVGHLKAAWTYTHHLPNRFNQYALREATKKGFVVNLSADHLDQAVTYKQRGYPTVCIVKDMPTAFEHKGVAFVRCPHQIDGGRTQCVGCGNGYPLCAQGDRDFVVAFEEH